MRIPLTKYGRREMLIATGVCGVAAVAAAVLFWPIVFLPVVVWGFVLFFFRDPPRRPDADDAFLSPADGKVVDITPVGEESPLGADGMRIGVFMSILDIHVNRSPCAGTVGNIEHHDGGHVDARRPIASEQNESATIWLTHSRQGRTFTVVVRQIAGLIARRIVTDLCVGQEITAGRRIGMVKFGSRLEVMIPHGLLGRIDVRVGQTVRAGKTVLAHMPHEPGGPAQEKQS